MQWQITTFHNLRHLDPRIVPFSTAVWDPKWFVNAEGTLHQDKRGVWYGLRYESLVPGELCHNLCFGPETCGATPNECAFLAQYEKQLNRLNFERCIQEMELMARIVCPEAIGVALLVYEKPDNPCSERWPLLRWFAAHGKELVNHN